MWKYANICVKLYDSTHTLNNAIIQMHIANL